MKTITALGATLLVAVSAFAPPALAQYRGSHDHDSRDRYERRQERREDRRESREERREDRRDARDERRDDRHDAIAQQHRRYADHDRYDRDRNRYDRDRYDRHDRYERRDRYVDHSRRYYAPRTYRPAYVYVAPRGYRVSRWNVGHRMPPPFYARPYYVDPLAYQLRMPPRGYRWVRVDRDVYLVSVTSGLIADVLYGIFR